MTHKMERWQARVNDNAAATERWTRRLLRAATELGKLRQERKRLMATPKPTQDLTITSRFYTGVDKDTAPNDDIPEMLT